MPHPLEGLHLLQRLKMPDLESICSLISPSYFCHQEPAESYCILGFYEAFDYGNSLVAFCLPISSTQLVALAAAGPQAVGQVFENTHSEHCCFQTLLLYPLECLWPYLGGEFMLLLVS